MTKIPDTKPTTPTTVRNVRELGERASAGPMPRFGAPEPCLWVNTHEMQGRRWKGNNNGKPSIAHEPMLGERGERIVDERTRSRYRTMVDHHGFEIYAVHTNAAAHVTTIEHGRFSRDGFTQYMIAKAYGLGWIDVHGGCLVRMVRDGLVRSDRLLVDLKGAKMCATDAASCKHTAAEKTARQAKNKAIQDARELAMQSEEKKSADSTKALTEQIAALVLKLGAKETK